MSTRKFFASLTILLSLSVLPCVAHAQPTEAITVALNAPAHPFPHFWEEMFGSGRANLSLRDSYRQDMRTVKAITNFRYVRFHGIFDDENGVYSEDANGNPIYNWSYVDQIYDGLLQQGVRPFVELSFMPAKLSSTNHVHPFWYHPLPNPPSDYKKWGDLNYEFARHLVQRYGIDEVSKWYFEVWNEPNIDFWSGDPKQPTYFDLYDSAVRAIKRADSRLRVGGPATAQAAWADQFIKHCADNHVPVDFVSTHVYANDSAQDVFHTNENIPRKDMVARAVRHVHEQIAASPMPHLPLIWSEFNASYMNEPDVTDSAFMGPWLANTIRACDGYVDVMSYWTFSDVFEEQGVIKTPFYGGFGLLAERGIPKAAFNDFKLLHTIGTHRIANSSEDVLVTRRDDGSYAVAVWNYAPPETASQTRQIALHFTGTNVSNARVTMVDPTHGSPLGAFAAMGRPASPTAAQIKALKSSARYPSSQPLALHNGAATITLPSWCLAVVEVK